MISVHEAQQLVLEQASLLPNEKIDLESALGRVLSENVEADRNYPPFNRAAMDGYAIRSSDITIHNIKEFEVAGELLAGHTFSGSVASGQCIKIMTGAATPLYLDCIIQVEKATVSGKKVTFEDIKPYLWQNIAREGEDCQEGEVILEEGRRLGPTDIATLAVLGKNKLLARSLPKVAILSTGDELIPVGQSLKDFQIRDSNSYALSAFFKLHQVTIGKKEIVKDNPEALKASLASVLDFDIIVLSGGVSMGDADFVPTILAELGVRKIFHKIKLKPGKPLWFGKSARGVVFGLPGNPLSCQVCFKLFIEPYLRKIMGIPLPDLVYLEMGEERKKKVNIDEYFPVKIEDQKLFPLLFNGSGDVTSTVGSSGIALHPIDKGDLKPGNITTYINWI